MINELSTLLTVGGILALIGGVVILGASAYIIIRVFRSLFKQDYW